MDDQFLRIAINGAAIGILGVLWSMWRAKHPRKRPPEFLYDKIARYISAWRECIRERRLDKRSRAIDQSK